MVKTHHLLLSTKTQNRYHCFGCGANGDVFDFITDHEGLSFKDAAIKLGAGGVPLLAKPIEPKSVVEPKQDPIVPTSTAPTTSDMTHYKLGKPANAWAYRNAEGDFIGVVLRFNQADGKKQVLPLTHTSKGWVWRSFPKPRPLYNLHELAARPDAPVLVVEGEKAAKRAHDLYPTHVATTWIGGADGIRHADFSPLTDRQLIFVPDNDEAGIEAMQWLQDKHAGTLVDTSTELPKWDIADFDPDTTTEQALEWLQSRLTPRKTLKPVSERVLQQWPEMPKQSVATAALAVYYADRFTYDPVSGMWHEWATTHWASINETVMFSRVMDDVTYALMTIGKGFDVNFINGILKMLCAKMRNSEWTTCPDFLPCQNGILNTRTNTLEPHAPDGWLNWVLPYDYDPNATCPTITKYLEGVASNDAPTIKLLQAWLNAVIKGRTDLQKFLELIGAGGTGKSTFLNLCSMVIGEHNTHATELKTLENNNFEASALYGKRLALITDSSRYGGDVDALKALTGGDPIRYEAKFKREIFTFKPSCLVMLAANEAVQSTDSTSGLARRRLTLRFDNVVADEDKDPYLEDKFRDELSGVVTWALQLSDAETTHIIRNPPQSAIDAKLNAIVSTNPIAGWLEECTVYGEAHDALIKDLYASYVEWCKDNGNKYMAKSRFRG